MLSVCVLRISTGNAHLFSSSLMHRPRSSCLIVWRCLETISGNELKETKRPCSFFFLLRHTRSETWIILIHSLKLAFCSANKCLLLLSVEPQLNTKAACDVLVVSQLQEESTAVRTCFVVVPLFCHLKEKYSFTNQVSAEAETSLEALLRINYEKNSCGSYFEYLYE